jgi:hypothetical protein
MTKEIDAAALTTFEVAPDGSHVRLNVRDRAGQPASLVLPAASVNQLLMTLPRVAQTALRRSHGDDSLRFVHPLESFVLELGEIDANGRQQIILTMKTGGGFSVSFGGSEEAMTGLGRSLVHDIVTDPLSHTPSLLRS